MSSKNKSQLRTENNSSFPNNNSQFITPQLLRDFNADIIDSMVINQDTGSYLITSSFDNGTRLQTFTKVDGTTYTNLIPDATVETGSLLETASFDNGTRNMTFTKGDASTFDINIPGSSLDTGSLLVTASVVDATTTYTKGNGDVFTTTIDNVINATSASHAEFADQATDAEDLYVTVKNTSGGIINKGLAVHATGVTGENINVILADSSTPSTMPAIGLLEETLAINATGRAIINGRLKNVDTSGLSAGANIFINGAGTLTVNKPTGSDEIQSIGVAGKIDASEGEIIIQGAGRVNDLPNIAEGYVWVGDSNSVPQAVLTSSFAESTDTGSFINTGSDTQTKNANIIQSITAPATDTQKNFIQIDSTENNGLTYLNNTFAIQNYPSFGRSYQDTLLFEMYNSTNYDFGTELGLNGGQFQVSQLASGSGKGALFRIQDDYAAGTDVDLHGTTINIGTFGSTRLASGGITIGRTDVPVTIASTELNINGPTNINGSLTASIDTGNVLVGDGSGVSYLVPTSSLVDTGSFARTDTANTFTGGIQLASGSNNVFTSQPSLPTTGAVQKVLVNLNGQNAEVAGNGPYTTFQSTISHFDGYGRWYDGSLYNEALMSSFEGAEEIFNGGGWKASVIASGSGYTRGAELYIQDDYDQSTSISAQAQQINIGTLTSALYQARDGINIGSSVAALNLNSSGITVSSSLDIEGNLTSSLQEGYVWVGDSSGRTITAATSSFGGGGGSAFPFTGDAQITGSLGVSGSVVIQQDTYPDNRLGFKSGSTEYIQMYIDTGSEFVPDAWVINHHTAGQVLGIANSNGWIEVNTNLNMNNNSIIRGDLTIRNVTQEPSYTATFETASINATLTLAPQNPLPTGAVGELATSGSNLYFHNGTIWKEVSFV